MTKTVLVPPESEHLLRKGMKWEEIKALIPNAVLIDNSKSHAHKK